MGALVAVACAKPTDAAARLDRPAPPMTGDADARILYVAAAVDVVPVQGAAFAARAGHDLVRSDTLRPGPSSIVVVQLRNGHAVRVDDAGPLAVKDMLLIDAPPTTRPAQEQLVALLDPGETAVPLDDVRDRAAAWRQMLRAGESAGGAREENAMKGEAESATDELGKSSKPNAPPVSSPAQQPAPAAEADMPRRSPPPPPRAPQPSGKKERADSAGGSQAKAKAKAKAKDAADDADIAKLDAGIAVPAGFSARFGATPADARPVDVPPALAPIADALTTCLAQDLQRQGVRLGAVELRLEVASTKIARVRLAGGLPVPACAKDSVSGVVVGLGDGWLVVVVPLPAP